MSAHATSGQPAGFAVLIPAYRPGPALVELVERLARSEASAILVVDDGNGPEFADRFRQLQDIPGVRLLQHAVNLGKGAALKTGINYFLCTFSDGAGVVTADADGQHTPGDVLRIGAALQAHPDSLILGSLRERLLEYSFPIAAIFAVKGLETLGQAGRFAAVMFVAAPLLLLMLLALDSSSYGLVEAPWLSALGSLDWATAERSNLCAGRLEGAVEGTGRDLPCSPVRYTRREACAASPGWLGRRRTGV